MKGVFRCLVLARKPRITAGLLTSMEIRDKFLLDMKTTTDPDLKAFLASLYNLYLNRIVSLLPLSKKNYCNNFSAYFISCFPGLCSWTSFVSNLC